MINDTVSDRYKINLIQQLNETSLSNNRVDLDSTAWIDPNSTQDFIDEATQLNYTEKDEILNLDKSCDSCTNDKSNDNETHCDNEVDFCDNLTSENDSDTKIDSNDN